MKPTSTDNDTVSFSCLIQFLSRLNVISYEGNWGSSENKMFKLTLADGKACQWGQVFDFVNKYSKTRRTYELLT